MGKIRSNLIIAFGGWGRGISHGHTCTFDRTCLNLDISESSCVIFTKIMHDI